MALSHPPFLASPSLLAVYKGTAALRRGQKSAAVRLLQAALIQLGYALPGSVDKKGIPDGSFGSETETVVKAFQSNQSLKDDGIIGAKTLSALDSTLASPKPVPSFNPKWFMSSREYKVGTDDPPYPSDMGAGAWKSKPVQATYLALWATLDLALATLLVFGKDATNHMRHYLAGSGRDYAIDLEAMLREVPSARRRLEKEVAQARTLVEILPEGTHSITSKDMDWDYNMQTENPNWYFAVGGYNVWGKGQAKVWFRGGVRHYELDFGYHLRDRYNWDGGKEVAIPTPFPDVDPIIITDAFMGEFHRQGLAREFFCVGKVRRKLSWQQGLPISQAQLAQPAGGRG